MTGLPCIHWTGLNHETCKAGVNYRELANGAQPGLAFRLPCWTPSAGRNGHEAVPCAQRFSMTLKQRAAEEAEEARHFERFVKAMPTINAWRNKPPIGKREVIECPVCSGRLTLAQAPGKGHVSGVCSTPGCLKFME